MSNATTERELFRPLKSRAETKSENTDHIARAIIGAEVARREEKTERLKKARLERQASADGPTPAAKQRRTKAATVRRGKSST